MTLKDLVRPNIWNLSPYTCARNEFTGEALAWLDANENSRICQYNRYPDPLQMEVKQQLGAYRGVNPENIFLGVGSDECIDIAYRVFCRPGIDNVVAIEPTYGMYQVCADVNDVEYRRVSLNDDFSLDVDAIINACDEKTKIVWICSPNNPTANAFPLEQIKEICSRFNGITIVDEAYIDFSPLGSMVQFLNDYPRMIVMQTFSKAWASAAIRLGISYASDEIINIYNKVKYPYNISELTQQEALKVLADSTHIEAIVKELIDARNALAEKLSTLPDVKYIYPSDANFLLVKVSDADAIYKYLRDEKVIVRNRTRVHKCGECLRLTIGNDAENALLIEKLTEYGNTRK
jgi:histidinol-phosphate aminotransferase